MIPEGNTLKEIKQREQIIRDFYHAWKAKNPSHRKYNLSLKEYINIRMVSIVETSEHAAKNYLSTLAVLQLDSILIGAKTVSIKKIKPNNKNQQPFERIMIMEYEMVREIKNLCPNNQMRDIFFEEVETDDPENYVRQLLKGRAVSVSSQQESRGVVTVYADCDGLIQKFIFTPV